MEYLFALIIFILAFMGLAVGLLVNKRIKGTCGGLGALFGKDCASCDCQENKEKG